MVRYVVLSERSVCNTLGLINILQPPNHSEGDFSLILIYITDIMIFTISFYPEWTFMSIDTGRVDSLYKILINRKK
jgi:hypothetical protein